MSIYAALELLATAADTAEQNAKIQATEGNIEQASLSASNAVEYRAALVILNAAQEIHGK